MSPIVTLYVGPERVEFRAYLDTVCQLPFFKAALHGNFKEASERVITMPEDGPSEVSALIEFLYTGNYTYTYDPESVHFREGSFTPVADLTEGLFHVGIHVIASKYDCKVLVGLALRNFTVVVTGLRSIDGLRLWKAAFSDGLKLPYSRQAFAGYCDGKGLVVWIQGLFDEHSKEMEKTMLEYPELSCELLRIATGRQ